MSTYTTGELAKLCGVTVRTVQYYDDRGILTPTELSEGGRRLYSDDDVKLMKTICFLRELDLPIRTISELLKEEHPEAVIELLLIQQENLLREEIDVKQEKLDRLSDLRRMLKTVKQFSVESIGDMAHQMENKKKLRKVRAIMLGVGIPLELIEIGAVVIGIKFGIWWPLVVSIIATIAGAIWMSAFYYKSVDYICPQCNSVFHPAFREMFWANHTPNTRKLTCPKCGHKGFCVEVYSQKDA